MPQELRNEPEKFKKEAIRGWLLVLVIDVILGVALRLYGIIFHSYGGYVRFIQFNYPGAFWYDLGYAALSMTALYLIHRRKQSVIPLLQFGYAISFIEGLISGGLNDTYHLQVGAVIWIFYLWNSDRVKRTFTQ